MFRKLLDTVRQRKLRPVSHRRNDVGFVSSFFSVVIPMAVMAGAIFPNEVDTFDSVGVLLRLSTPILLSIIEAMLMYWPSGSTLMLRRILFHILWPQYLGLSGLVSYLHIWHRDPKLRLGAILYVTGALSSFYVIRSYADLWVALLNILKWCDVYNERGENKDSRPRPAQDMPIA